MKVLAVLGICLVVAQALPTEEFATEWDLYKKTHGKEYGAEEDARRMNIYMDNKKKISEHNEKFSMEHVSYQVNINKFTDMLESEVKAMMNGYTGGIIKTGTLYVDDGRQAATTVDWRNKGVVTPVKSQGQCASSWSFATTGSLEGQHALKTGRLVSLSEQNLVDCSGKYGNQGCSGGDINNAFQYINANGGIDTEKSYPYIGQEGPCLFSRKNVGARITGFVGIPEGDESALMNAVSKIGPVSVAIDASNWSFQQYSGGVYDEPHCSSHSFNHGVLVVGYGYENGRDYWLVKNSWGTDWGESGYIKMTRNSNNQCGIASQASYPTV